MGIHEKVIMLCGYVQKMAKQGEQEECRRALLFVKEKELLLLCQVG